MINWRMGKLQRNHIKCFNSVQTCYLEKETKAHPLIVSIDLFVIGFAFTVTDTRIWHFLAGLLEEHAFERIRAVNPAVSVEHIFRYVLGVDAVNWIADVLSRRHNQRKGYQHHDGD